MALMGTSTAFIWFMKSSDVVASPCHRLTLTGTRLLQQKSAETSCVGGDRVAEPQYDGDMLLLEEIVGFRGGMGEGILYINNPLAFVTWTPVSVFTNYHCFRMKGS